MPFTREVCSYIIGSTNNLSTRFKGYKSSDFKDDPCKKATTSYKREYTKDYENKESQYLEEYKAANGKLPRCNDVIP